MPRATAAGNCRSDAAAAADDGARNDGNARGKTLRGDEVSFLTNLDTREGIDIPVLDILSLSAAAGGGSCSPSPPLLLLLCPSLLPPPLGGCALLRLAPCDEFVLESTYDANVFGSTNTA